MNAILLLYLVFIVAPISNFFHELGHMFGAKLAKADKVVLSIGRGKMFFGWRWKNNYFEIRSFFFTAGITISEREKEYNSIEMIYITFLGPFFNAIIVFIFYLLYINLANPFVLLILLYNGWLSLINLVPFKIAKQESDGYIMMRETIRLMYKSR